MNTDTHNLWTLCYCAQYHTIRYRAVQRLNSPPHLTSDFNQRPKLPLPYRYEYEAASDLAPLLNSALPALRPAPVRLLIRVDLFYLFLGTNYFTPLPLLSIYYSYRIPSFVSVLDSLPAKLDRACCIHPLRQLLISLLSLSFVPEFSCLAIDPPVYRQSPL